MSHVRPSHAALMEKKAMHVSQKGGCQNAKEVITASIPGEETEIDDGFSNGHHHTKIYI